MRLEDLENQEAPQRTTFPKIPRSIIEKIKRLPDVRNVVFLRFPAPKEDEVHLAFIMKDGKVIRAYLKKDGEGTWHLFPSEREEEKEE